MIKVTTKLVLNEFKRRNVPIEIVTEEPMVLLKYFHNGVWHLLQSTLPEHSSAVGRLVCDQKLLAGTVAQSLDIPTPETMTYTTENAAQSFLKQYKSIVVKPADAAHGSGVSVGIHSKVTLKKAIILAKQFSKNGNVLLQRYVSGSDVRLLIIGGQFNAAVRRIPAAVRGDGRHTLRSLIEQENHTNPERGENDEKRLAKIDTTAAERFLGRRFDTHIPAKNEMITVVGTANIGAGGHAEDYTDKLPQTIIADAEKFAQVAGVAACGVDFIWDEVNDKYYFIEGNATPGFMLHMNPSVGASRPVVRAFADFLLGQAESLWQTSKRSDSNL